MGDPGLSGTRPSSCLPQLFLKKVKHRILSKRFVVKTQAVCISSIYEELHGGASKVSALASVCGIQAAIVLVTKAVLCYPQESLLW